MIIQHFYIIISSIIFMLSFNCREFSHNFVCIIGMVMIIIIIILIDTMTVDFEAIDH